MGKGMDNGTNQFSSENLNQIIQELSITIRQSTKLWKKFMDSFQELLQFLFQLEFFDCMQ